MRVMKNKEDSLIEQYARGWKIFVDTCSLLHPSINDFWDAIMPYLKKYDNKVLIASANYRELEKHAKNKINPGLAKKANESLATIGKLWNEGYVEIRGEKDELFADNVFLYVFTKFRLTYNLLLITQDKALAKDIDALNSLESAKTKNNICVKRLSRKGNLENIV